MVDCPNCSQENPEGARFCNNCAAPLVAGVITTPSLPSSFADGRYVVEQKLGEGGKGSVFLCQDTTLGRRVAIKLIKEEVMDPDSLARFQREVQTMGRLMHPNVVTIHDIGQEGGRHFLVLELMEGGDVEHLIRGNPNGRLDVPTAVRLASDMARGLVHAHGHDILHRDIKPGNTWLTGDGLAKLGDFGLAYLGGGTRLTRAGMMVGTVAYMAPEVALGRQADERSDLYMLGASLYEMVTGRVPFQGDDPVRVIFSHINDLPLSPRRLVPDIPPALETLITRLLSKDPEQRPANACAVLDALAQVTTAPAQQTPLTTSATTEPAVVQPPTPEPRWAQPMVGRDRELNALRARVDAAMQGQSGLVFITGEAGIGKTRLAAELRSYARGRGCQWLEGHYQKEGGIPYQPWVEAVRGYMRNAVPVSDLVGQYGPDLMKVFPELAEQLDKKAEGSSGPSDPEGERHQLYQGMAHFFSSIARQSTPGALVLFIDDLQWAPSLATLHFLAQRATSEPILLIGAYRDEELRERQPHRRSVLAMNRERLFEPVPLHRLEMQDVTSMVNQILGQNVAPELAALVYERTGGNPFFVEELMRYLVEGRAVSLSDQGWEVRDTASLEVPDSVRLVVEERMEHLSSEARQMLAVASVVGQEFEVPLLQDVTGLDEEALLDFIDLALEARVLIPRTALGHEVYAFSDNQVRDVLYQGVSPTRRRRYHLRVGQAMEKAHARRLEEHWEALAHHFTEGNDLEKAIQYNFDAGEKARRQYSFERARGHFSTACDLLEEDEDNIERLAETYERMGDMTYLLAQPALDQYVRALDLCQQAGSTRTGALHSKIGREFTAGSLDIRDYQKALEHHQAGITLLEGASPNQALAYLYIGLCFDHISMERVREALEWAERAVDLATSLDASGVLSQAYLWLGCALVASGRVDEGITSLDKATDVATATSQPSVIGVNHAWRAVTLGLLRKVDSTTQEAERLLQVGEASFRYQQWGHAHAAWAAALSGVSVQASQLYQAASDLQQRFSGIGAVGEDIATEGLISLIAGEWDRSEERLWEGVGIGERSGDKRAANTCRQILAVLAMRWGDYDTSRQLAEEALSVYEQGGNAAGQMRLFPLLCESYVRLGRLEEAQFHLTGARDILTQSSDWFGLAAGVYHAEGVLAAAEERWDEAGAAFERAADTNEQHGLLYDQAQALYEWAAMYLDRNETGDRERGSELLDKALDIFQRCDARKDVEKVIARKEFLGGVIARFSRLYAGVTL